MYSYEISELVDFDYWNTLLQNVDYSTLFQTADYLDYESASGDRFPLFIKIRNEKKEIIGQLGVVIIKSTNAYSSPFLQQFLNIFSGLCTRALWAGGPIIHSNDPKIRLDVLKEVIKALERIAMQYNLDVISGYTPHQDLNIEDSYLNSFKTENYSIENFLTFAIDLTLDEETIWNGIDKNARRDVSRAEKRGIFVKELESFEELKDYFSLAEKWAVTKGISVKTSDEQIIKYWKYYQRGIEKIFLAYDNNELISTHRLGIFNKVIFSHRLTSSYAKATSLGGPLLVWHAIKWAKSKNMKFYDFSGGKAPPKDPEKHKEYLEKWGNLLAFKRKWGGIEFPYFQLIKVTKPKSYKLFRVISKPDWIYREYKKKRYNRRRKSLKF